MKLCKKFLVKIPDNVKLIYKKEQNLLLIIGSLDKKIMKLNFKIFFPSEKNSIYVTGVANDFFSNIRRKKKKSLRISEINRIEQNILGTSNLINVKLKLVGVGYKIFEVDHVKNLYQFKLGFSHHIFYKIPENVGVFIKKNSLVYLSSNTAKVVTQTASKIRSYKKPEPYKGKGILYENEVIKLKQGKKI